MPQPGREQRALGRPRTTERGTGWVPPTAQRSVFFFLATPSGRWHRLTGITLEHTGKNTKQTQSAITHVDPVP